MSESPFAFYRGSALLMTHDLAQQSVTGTQLIICGDAHISNFGLYASPERRLVLDLNDFDEADLGPWEWDLKRMVTSVILGGEDMGLSKAHTREAALQAVFNYRTGLRKVMDMSSLERYFISIDEEKISSILNDVQRANFEKITKQAKRRTSSQVIQKFTVADSFGRRVFVDDPPVLTHVEPEIVAEVENYFEQYRKTVRPDIALLLSQHILTDIAMRVVGVGSVGRRNFLLVLTCENSSHIVLQVKEASQSVVSIYCTPTVTQDNISEPQGDGFRVAKNQQILQAFSDPFLGHFQSKVGREFYVRQFRDMKGSVDLEKFRPEGFILYAGLCGQLLARAHGQSSNANWVSGYMGSSEHFDESIVDWCYAYSKQVYRDYKQFIK